MEYILGFIGVSVVLAALGFAAFEISVQRKVEKVRELQKSADSVRSQIVVQEEPCQIDAYRITDSQITRTRDYFVIDVETTGLDRKNDKIIEIAWIEIKGRKEAGRFSTFVNPEMPISKSASQVNGIYDEDIADAPTYAEIRDKVKSALLNSTVVGHNVTFDVDFIKRLIGNEQGRICYIDTQRLAKQAFRDLQSYKLEKLCEELNLEVKSSHRAMRDVEATECLFEKCVEVLKERQKIKSQQSRERRAIDREERLNKYGNSPLFEKAFVYTGTFTKDRYEMERLAESVGAFARQSVTSKTDYLVVGDLTGMPEWALERKLKKAEGMIEQNGKIKKISEQEYLKLIDSAKESI